MELKEPLSFEKQIEKLKSHGMVMGDEAKVKEILFLSSCRGVGLQLM